MTSRLLLEGVTHSVVVAPLQRTNTGNMPTREFAVVMPSLLGLRLENRASETCGNVIPDPMPYLIGQNYDDRPPSSEWCPLFSIVLLPAPSVLAAGMAQPRASSPNLCLSCNVLGKDSGGSWQRPTNFSQSLPSASLSQLRRQTEADESRNFVHRRRASLHRLTHDAWLQQCSESKRSRKAWLQQWRQQSKQVDA